MNINLDTWIISDTHLGHYNMVKLCNRPLNFNEKIIEKWQKLVKPEDTILHLGDLVIFFGPTSHMWASRAGELPGHKYLIRGNHDKEHPFYYELLGFALIEMPYLDVKIGHTNIRFSHEPQKPSESWDLNIHGHMHGNTHHTDDLGFKLGEWHIDAGVDVYGYKPIRLGELLNGKS